jgi:uncharacterized membrane protein
MKSLYKLFILFNLGGLLYYNIEILWRGYSHWTMYILGGLVFILIGEINNFLSWETPLCIQCGIATIIVTVLEFITGCIINLWLGWNIWHYSRFDILGQICLPYVILWYFLSSIAIILDDYVRWILFNEQKPKYKLF